MDNENEDNFESFVFIFDKNHQIFVPSEEHLEKA